MEGRGECKQAQGTPVPRNSQGSQGTIPEKWGHLTVWLSLKARAHSKCRILQELIIYSYSLQMHSLQKDKQLAAQWEWLSKTRLQGLPLKTLQWALPSAAPFLSHNKTILTFCVKCYVKASILPMLGKRCCFPSELSNFYNFGIHISR